MGTNLYKTMSWKHKRKRILRRDEYRCRECSRYGRSVEATTVHHIYPVERWPGLVLTNENLVSLCSSCHDKMHDRVTNELTATGLAWQNRVDLLKLIEDRIINGAPTAEPIGIFSKKSPPS